LTAYTTPRAKAVTYTVLAHITGISPLRGSLRAARRQEYHDRLMGFWQEQAATPALRTDGFRFAPFAVFDAGSLTAHAGGLGASSAVALPISGAIS